MFGEGLVELLAIPFGGYTTLDATNCRVFLKPCVVCTGMAHREGSARP
jgi:hypothetical protein